MNMLFMIALLLPLALVECKTGCWAGPPSRSRACVQQAVLHGQLSLDVRYKVTSSFTHVCCEALECSDFRGCRLSDIGCGQGIMTSQRLVWELRDIHPVIRCNASDPADPGFYTFEVRFA